MKRILLVEDDLSLIEGLKFSLSKHGFDVAVARALKEAESLLDQNEYNLIILDLMLPDGSGFDLCRAIRQVSDIPIIFLTASDEEVNIVMGLDIGGDDYITKPFKLNELISRINAVLRRFEPAGNRGAAELTTNGITVKPQEGRAIKNGNDLRLTSAEFRLLRSLIGNLLKMAKLDAGVIELNIGNHVLSDLIKQAAESFEARMSKEQKTFEIKASGDMPYPCDREWMPEAVSNLIKNAVEHTAAGNRISATVEETPIMVRITIKDSGEGIHPDDIKHIFKRFYRSRFSQNKQGTGIGLNIAKTVIEMHGGFISVESTAGKGSAFTIHLPKLTKL